MSMGWGGCEVFVRLAERSERMCRQNERIGTRTLNSATPNLSERMCRQTERIGRMNSLR